MQSMMVEQDSASVVSKMTISTISTSGTTTGSSQTAPIMTNGSIVVPSLVGTTATLPDTKHRAVHQIRLSALSHNYSCVESAANRQRCSVIVVVKADGYGHGAIASALHLADSCGADAFAVATLEEAVALRRAFDKTPRNAPTRPPISSLFCPPDGIGTPDGESIALSRAESPTVAVTATTTTSYTTASRSMRPPHIRIVVLGPPVGYPRCFDDYYYYNVELMVSGPEVASALLEWVSNSEQRKRTLVERAAWDAKQEALTGMPPPRDPMRPPNPHMQHVEPTDDDNTNNNGSTQTAEMATRKKRTPHTSATLSNVSGQDLAKEVRAILMNQQAATARKSQPGSMNNSGRATPVPSTTGSIKADGKSSPPSSGNGFKAGMIQVTGEVFGGIEAAAKSSRNRQMAVKKASEVCVEDSSSSESSTVMAKTNMVVTNIMSKRKLRWHADVDSGMGRLGFKTEPLLPGDVSGRRDTVSIIKELVDMEVCADAPLEFYGMCTHMAEANSSSDYTNAQIGRFKALLKRVRNAGIFVPTVSTDNSAALLTTNLTHFDPDEILSQPDAHTRGFVRTGGAIYGQRPAFPQLLAVSTLKASVRHVAVLKKGESVGYDRAYIAPMDVRIATLTIGFADGYPRELGNGVGKVSIRGAVFPVAGNVCMDMMMVELGPAEDVASTGARVVVGDVAVLWGPETEYDGEGLVRLQDLAAALKTTQSALTCSLNTNRVSRELI